MPQIIFTATALSELERLREFLRSKNPPTAQRAASAIINTIRKLESYLLMYSLTKLGLNYRQPLSDVRRTTTAIMMTSIPIVFTIHFSKVT
ncbi:type II toxin-antitoxin system RelE/ParE family toxin [Shewanella xiamenensis]|uniref:type II toxin-antitoxin system RelE/ParE family toxin n=1 Tax=Shewanella xiamenensis TaxID=332186 RepID=UPI00313C6FD6